MGSTGSGNFSDYQGYSGKNPKQGGESKQSECGKAFRTDLEDVELSEFFTQNGTLPPVESPIEVTFNGTRIVAIQNNLEIGYLPTRFNYLIACLQEFNYSGIISSLATAPISSLTINVSPDE